MKIYYKPIGMQPRELIDNPYQFRIWFLYGWVRAVACQGTLYTDYPANTQVIGRMLLLTRYFGEEDYR